MRDGWSVLERGYRLGRREVDVIARRRDLLVFVEVKTRTVLDFGPPEEAVTRRKRREIETVATDYLMRHVYTDLRVRFDVVSVVAGPGRTILRCEHLEDAWRPER